MRDSKNHANLDGEGLNPVIIVASVKNKVHHILYALRKPLKNDTFYFFLFNIESFVCNLRHTGIRITVDRNSAKKP